MIIKCPECGHDVSDKAKKCVHCGYSLRKEKLAANKKRIKTICVAAISVIILIAILLVSFLWVIPSVQKKKASTLDDMILGIGDVTIEDEETIRLCRKQYDEMSAKTQSLVENENILKSAENELDHLNSILHDKTGPQIDEPDEPITFIWLIDTDKNKALESLSFHDDVSSSDKIEVSIGDIDMETPGVKEVEVTAKDEAGNTTTKEISVSVQSRYSYLCLIELNEARYGVKQIKSSVKSPNSLSFHGFRVNDGLTYIHFSAQNSFGAELDYYARASWDVAGLFDDEFWCPTESSFQWLLEKSYNEGTESFTGSEYNEFINSPYAELTRDEVFDLRDFIE